MAFLNNADEPDIDIPPPDAAVRQIDREKKAAKLLAELPDNWPLATESIIWQLQSPRSRMCLSKPATAQTVVRCSRMVRSSSSPRTGSKSGDRDL